MPPLGRLTPVQQQQPVPLLLPSLPRPLPSTASTSLQSIPLILEKPPASPTLPASSTLPPSLHPLPLLLPILPFSVSSRAIPPTPLSLLSRTPLCPAPTPSPTRRRKPPLALTKPSQALPSRRASTAPHLDARSHTSSRTDSSIISKVSFPLFFLSLASAVQLRKLTISSTPCHDLPCVVGQCNFEVRDAVEKGLSEAEAEEKSRPYLCKVGEGCTKRYRQMNGLRVSLFALFALSCPVTLCFLSFSLISVTHPIFLLFPPLSITIS
jgi:hypothetical protein